MDPTGELELVCAQFGCRRRCRKVSTHFNVLNTGLLGRSPFGSFFERKFPAMTLVLLLCELVQSNSHDQNTASDDLRVMRIDADRDQAAIDDPQKYYCKQHTPD